ncbi:MAG: hypothetical protein C0396_00645 [Anaerolinea sp.]|nr:hypothetical protein [Anaerolinea sp.]
MIAYWLYAGSVYITVWSFDPATALTTHRSFANHFAQPDDDSIFVQYTNRLGIDRRSRADVNFAHTDTSKLFCVRKFVQQLAPIIPGT